jgi:hypothetical protein
MSQKIPFWLNPTMKFLLNSPLHNLISDKILLISFTGRKSGNHYTTPVSYLKEDDTVKIFTHSKWWKNFDENGTPVELKLQGKSFEGKAHPVVDDKEVVAMNLAKHLKNNHIDAKFYGVEYDDDGNPNMDDVRRGAEDTVLVEVKLTP